MITARIPHHGTFTCRAQSLQDILDEAASEHGGCQIGSDAFRAYVTEVAGMPPGTYADVATDIELCILLADVRGGCLPRPCAVCHRLDWHEGWCRPA